MAVIVVSRELLVTALRGFIEGEGGDFSAKMAGKLKMVFQCAAVVTSLIVLMMTEGTEPAWLIWTLHILVWLSIISTIHSVQVIFLQR